MKGFGPAWLRWMLIGLVIVAGLIGLGWLARKPLTSWAIETWCQKEGFSCDVVFKTLETQRVEIDQFSIEGVSSKEVFSARALNFEIEWGSGFMPQVKSIEADQMALTASYDGRTFRMDGVERLLEGDGGSTSAPIPKVNLKDGQLALTTPAGVISGHFSVLGTMGDDGQILISLNPADLAQDGNQLTLQSGNVVIEARRDELSGEARLEVETAKFLDLRVNTLQINARLANAADPALDWQFAAGKLSQDEVWSIEGFQTEGQILLDRMALLSAFGQRLPLKSGEMGGRIERFDFPEFTASGLQFQAAVEAQEDGAFALEANTSFSEAITAYGAAGQGAADWAGDLMPYPLAVEGGGELVLSGVVVEAGLRNQLKAFLSGDHFLGSHLSRLSESLDQGLSNASVRGRYQLSKQDGTDWRTSFPEEVNIGAANGLSLKLDANGRSDQGVRIEAGRIDYGGLLSLRRVGGPSINADITAFSYQDGVIDLRTGGVFLAPWEVDALSIGARLNQLSFQTGAGATRINLLGEMSLNGPVSGLELKTARLFGGVDAVRGREGWRVQTLKQECLGLDIATLTLAEAYNFRGIAFPICPENGRLMRQEAGVTTGLIDLGTIEVGLEGPELLGRPALEAAQLNWRAEEGLSFTLTAEMLSLPLELGERTLELESEQPQLVLSLGGESVLTGQLGESVLSGSLVPAGVIIGQTTLDSLVTPQGLRGRAEAQRVRISDLRDDPIYRPLLADFDATFEGTEVQLVGPVRLADTGLVIADVDWEVDLSRLDGGGSVVARPLDFSPEGLQPKDISDRVRGFLSNGRGRLSGRADFQLKAGTLSGQGRVSATGFGFDTQRIGAVDGISGTIEFSDLLTLTTLPGQTLTIASMTPGIDLEAGEIRFQLQNASTAILEMALWPFAGGQLIVMPAEWTLGGASDVIEVQARQIDLAELVHILDLPDLEAEGTVSGQFPIVFDGGDVLIQQARLAVDERGGVLRYTGEAVSAASSTNETVKAAFDALRDFRYTVLEIEIDGNLVGELIVTLRLLGRNPEIYGGAEFKFNIAIDSDLMQLIRTGQDLTGSRVITDTILESLGNDGL